MLNCTPIPALVDNYIWLLQESRLSSQVYSVDPGEAHALLHYLEQHQLTLNGILLTHHHRDHTGAVPELLKRMDVPVYGYNTIEYVTHPVHDNDILNLPNLDCPLTALAIPGHTLDHIAYYGGNALFSGDTLFAGGCGRVFEGTNAQMLSSLNRLKALPDTTRIYCGHEYTLKNLQFALTVEPNNSAIKEQIKWVSLRLEEQQCSLPSTITIEKLTNPFLRCTEPTVIAAATEHAQKNLSSELEIFSELRAWKNHF